MGNFAPATAAGRLYHFCWKALLHRAITKYAKSQLGFSLAEAMAPGQENYRSFTIAVE